MKTLFGKNRSVFWRLCGPLVACSVILMSIVSFFGIRMLNEDLLSARAQRAEQYFSAIQTASHISGVGAELQRSIHAFGGDEAVDLIVIAAGSPKTVIVSTQSALLDLPVQEIPPAVFGSALNFDAGFQSFTNEHEHYFFLEPITLFNPEDANHSYLPAMVLIRFDMTADLKILSRKRIELVLACIGFVIIWWLAITLILRKHVSGPMQMLRDRMEAFGSGFEVPSGDLEFSSSEFISVAESFEGMKKSIERKSCELESERVKSVRFAKLASLGEMSAGIAHEINNPLTIIAGTAHVLSKFAGDPEKLKSRIEIIEKATARIAKIVRSLRKFSRSDEKSAKKVHLLAEIVEEAIIITGAKSRRHGTPVNFSKQANGSVWCDEIEIEQVLVNMINNGIDAVKTTTNKWVQIELTEEVNAVVMRIRDSGKGIAQDVQNHMFHPFFTTKPVGQGTGLGLSIAKGILDEHGAEIQVLDNDPNTCFELRFPKAEARLDAA